MVYWGLVTAMLRGWAGTGFGPPGIPDGYRDLRLRLEFGRGLGRDESGFDKSFAVTSLGCFVVAF